MAFGRLKDTAKNLQQNNGAKTGEQPHRKGHWINWNI
jgi:hypothetical protein